ncbi:MAG: MaoC/PaaZ C-terminal domain-containing protein [Candidatus Thorarchaeota archaeon]|jgi:acyl dehydratase
MTDETTKMNREFLGKEYHAGPQIVDSESVRKYARATNEKNPLYLSTESGAELVPPPLYPVVFLPDILSQLVDDSEKMDFDILRVVHAEHQMSWKETLSIGDEIHTTAKISNMEQRGVNEILDLHIRCRREDVTVVEMNYRLLSRGKKKAGDKKPTVPTHEPEKGKVLAKHQSVVAADQGARYAEASGDHNPIHISDEIARSVGLPSAILHGLCTMALASQALVDGLLNGNPMRLKSMSVRFSRPVLLDQTITTEVYEGGVKEDGLRVAHFETRDEKDVPVLILGTAEFRG